MSKSEYFGDAAPQTVGRTRLLRGTEPVAEPVEAAPIPAVTPSPVEPFHAPEARRWRKKRAKAAGAAGGHEKPAPASPSETHLPAPGVRNPTVAPAREGASGCEWTSEGNAYRHAGCGGEVVGVGKGRPFCRGEGCGVEWFYDRQARVWKRF